MKILLLASVLFVCLFANAQNAGSIPNNVRSYTILVIKNDQGIMQNRENKKLETAMAKYYTGSFKMVSKKDLESPEYADVSKYRYTIDDVVVGKQGTSEAGKTKNIYDVVFYDRSSKANLPSAGIRSDSYSEALQQLGKYLQSHN